MRAQPVRGDAEPTGAVHAYLLGGAPAAVGNLWDVTDRDIDALSRQLLWAWFGQEDGNGAGVTLAAAVAKARSACRLRMLNGAATVCYGVPVVAIEAPTLP